VHGPGIVKAGGNARYVVVAQEDKSDSRLLRYFYFARVPQERYGWGLNPERVVGPLTKAEFDRAREVLGLPTYNITIEDEDDPENPALTVAGVIVACAGTGIALLLYLLKRS
jgi:hypothetical protein